MRAVSLRVAMFGGGGGEAVVAVKCGAQRGGADVELPAGNIGRSAAVRGRRPAGVEGGDGAADFIDVGSGVGDEGKTESVDLPMRVISPPAPPLPSTLRKARLR